jgi:hypothetical protein
MKQPIDRLRNAAISARIGCDGDESAISEIIAIGDSLYFVKEFGIYAMQLADQIDPERTNAAIPNVQQRILAIGSNDPIVARTLLTAHTLFDQKFLGPSFDQENGLKLALELLKDFVALIKMQADLDAAEARAITSWENQEQDRGAFHLPSIGNAKQLCDAFAQKAGHVVNTLKSIARLFYREELKSKWIDSMTAIAADRYGDSSPFAQWMKNARPFLLYVLDLRNMIEHPAPGKYIKVNDFRLLATREIDRPSVEIVHPGEETATSTITMLMKTVTDDLVSVAEVLMAYLCSVHAQPFAGMSIHVVESPQEQRSKNKQRFCYGYFNGEQIVQFG